MPGDPRQLEASRVTQEEQIKYAMWLSRVVILGGGGIRQSCIASAKVTTEVLRSLGIAARPMAASILVATKAWVDKMEAGERPTEETWPQWEEAGAWSVGVAYDAEPQEGAWTAHMIVLAGPGQKYLLDPSLDQTARPEKGIVTEPAMIDLSKAPFNQHEFRRGRTQAIIQGQDEDTGTEMVIVWSLFPHDRTFRDSNDWKLFQVRYGMAARSIVQAIEKMKKDGLTGDTLPPLPPLPDAPDDPKLKAAPRAIGRQRFVAEQSR